MEEHNRGVAVIAASVKGFHDRGQPFRIYHGSTNSTRQLRYKRDGVVDVSSLVNVVNVDVFTQTALVEPNVPMDRLIEVTTKYGLLPPVVMEFPGITVGGGFSGQAFESSSFKYGGFDATIDMIEIVLGDGELTTASKTDKPDLLYGAAGSLGTLGVVTLLRICLVPARKYVQLTYQPVSDVHHALRTFESARKDSKLDYMEGVQFGIEEGVVMTGHLTDDANACTEIHRFNRASDQYFYIRAKEMMHRKSATTVLVPLVDYLFRYDRGFFWTSEFAFYYFMLPFNRVTRWLLDDLLHTRRGYQALHKSGLGKRYVIQDLLIPWEESTEFVEYAQSIIPGYPLWLCPYRHDRDPCKVPMTSTTPGSEKPRSEMLLDVGVWGQGPRDRSEFINVNRAIERKTHELGGLKVLYAEAFYTEDEFWDIYDRKRYEGIRTKYRAGSLPNIYAKCGPQLSKAPQHSPYAQRLLDCVKEIWPLRGLWGVLHVLQGGDYILAG